LRGKRYVRELLEKYKAGAIGEDELIREICKFSFELIVTETIKFDIERDLRVGFPEVIYAPGKKYEDLKKILKEAIDRKGLVFLSDFDNSLIEKVLAEFPEVEMKRRGKILSLRSRPRNEIGLKVGAITAGTSDVDRAEEFSLILEEMGFEVVKEYDVGISSIKRALDAVRKMMEEEVKLIVVFSGMDGILPTLVSSLVGVPVIGVPTSSFRGNGRTPLMTMLSSCSPGLLVVNVDNSVGAAAAAVRILNLLLRKDERPKNKNQ